MTLKDELDLLKKAEKNQQDQKQTLERLPFDLLSERLAVSEARQELLSEATDLISPKYWQTTKMSFDDNDVKGSYGSGLDFSEYYCCGMREYQKQHIKILYNGKTMLGRLKYISKGLDKKNAGLFFRSKCRELKQEVVRIANRQAADAQSYMSGSQEFIRLGYFDRWDDEHHFLVLFRDGMIFPDVQTSLPDAWRDDAEFKKWMLNQLARLSD